MIAPALLYLELQAAAAAAEATLLHAVFPPLKAANLLQDGQAHAAVLATTAVGMATTAVGMATTAVGLATTAVGLATTTVGLATTAAGMATTAVGLATTAVGMATTLLATGGSENAVRAGAPLDLCQRHLQPSQGGLLLVPGRGGQGAGLGI